MKRVEKVVLCCFLMVALVFSIAVSGSVAAPKTPAKKIFRVEGRTASFGGMMYIMGFAICDILNKKSTWVRGSSLESTGTKENIIVVGRDPKKRARTFFAAEFNEVMRAKKSKPPYHKPPGLYKDVMTLIGLQRMALFQITLDPNIRNIADLKGKRVASFPKGTTKYVGMVNCIRGAGKEVLDSIRWQYTGYGGYDDMLLGKVDAAWAFLLEMGSGRYTAPPKLAELMAKKRVYIVGTTPEQRALSAQTRWEPSYTIPANALAPGIPDEDKLVQMSPGNFSAYLDMPENVAYEILKILYENYKMIKDYHPAGAVLVPENFGVYSAPKERWHPGARKFYEEYGLEYGGEYLRKRYPGTPPLPKF